MNATSCHLWSRTMNPKIPKPATRDIIIATLSTAVGVFASTFATALLNNSLNIRDQLFAATAILILLTLVCASVLLASLHDKSTQFIKDSKKIIETGISDITEKFSSSSTILPSNKSYQTVTNIIQNAKQEILLLTYVTYDRSLGKRLFLPARRSSSERIAFYDALLEAAKNPDIRYRRIFQFDDENFDIHQHIIKQDRLFLREYEAIVEYTRKHPDATCGHVTPTVSTTSLLIVDGQHLFMNFDMKVQDGFATPANLLIQDVPASGIRPIIRQIYEISNKSTMIT